MGAVVSEHGRDSVGQVNSVVPAHGVDARDLEQFLGHSIGLRVVPLDSPRVAAELRNHLGEVADADITARSNVDDIRTLIIPYQEEQGIHQVIDMEQLAASVARAP